jgi:hypothetical protein
VSVAIQEIRKYEYQLTPGRYVSAGIMTSISTDPVIKFQRGAVAVHLPLLHSVHMGRVKRIDLGTPGASG